jgi:hypothetical protein
MNAYVAPPPWRQAVVIFVLLVVSTVVVATLLGLGWFLWDYLIHNPLPYQDPEPPAS